ncbi:PepSY domain-containing protein [Microbulbifer marinus]|uniref:PepSY-associated TM region n=1 Tax=Microbulbifer marinus TaxID=658218 RepID=A0A1H4BED5_9GAMM|nr:PepSY domain-containing protein [Microbulbifer marinus]SEA46457.1 PepSY-associated TM region [Microbulbifer marinus]
MKTATISRKVHKWIFLFIGVQALLWTLSGFYMVVMNLDFIHGDHLVQNLREPLPATSAELFPSEALLRDRAGVKSVQLKSIREKLFYVVRDADGAHLLDAHSGTEVSPLDQQTAIALAEYYYTGDQPAASAELISDNPPTELQSRPLPLWRVNFDDRYGTSFYIDPNTGALATRRHDYWRAFDFFWMLHIMDYEARENIHNPLLLIATLFSLVSVLAGLVLLFYSFGKRRNANSRQQQEATA